MQAILEALADDHLLTVPEAAKTCRMGQRTIWRFISKGNLPVRRFGRKCTRVTVGDLKQFIHAAVR